MQVFKFYDEIHHYQSFVKSNIRLLGNLVIVSEQLLLKNKHKNYIDILAYDLDENRIVILELKNVLAGDAIIGQSIRYYDNIIKSNPDSLYELLNQINVNNEDVNLTPRIILVAPDFNDQLLHSLNYINGIEISIVKLNLNYNDKFFEVTKEYFKPSLEETTINSKPFVQWSFEQYTKDNVNYKKIMLAKQFINYINNRLSNKNSVNIFFYDKKITITVNKKVWGNILIKQQPLNEYLNVSINNKDNLIDSSVLKYYNDIIKYKILNDSIKITFSKVPTNFLIDIC